MSFSTDSARWTAVRTKDVTADRRFVYCVKTTKIYCRPTCKARLARRSNVEFFDTASEAVTRGYRACKRCRPELDVFVPETDLMINAVRQLLEELSEDEPVPCLDLLASKAGLTKHHFHRSFKKATGFTPKQYALVWRTSLGMYPKCVDSSSTRETELPPGLSAVRAGGTSTPANTWGVDDCTSLGVEAAFSFDDFLLPEPQNYDFESNIQHVTPHSTP